MRSSVSTVLYAGFGRVFSVSWDRSKAAYELLRVSLSKDRVELTAVGVGDPQNDARRVQELRRAVEKRREGTRVDHTSEVDAQRSDAAEVG